VPKDDVFDGARNFYDPGANRRQRGVSHICSDPEAPTDRTEQTLNGRTDLDFLSRFSISIFYLDFLSRFSISIFYLDFLKRVFDKLTANFRLMGKPQRPVPQQPL